MDRILVTGATGGLGGAIITHLLARMPAERIVALARDTDKAAALAARGGEVRQGDYGDEVALTTAFHGIDRLFLVSATAFTDRVAQHAGVIRAAKTAGVRHILYTSIQRRPGLDAPIPGVTDSDVATERLLRDSGIDHTIIRHPVYLEVMPPFLGVAAPARGVRVPAGTGRVALTARDDLAEGAAALLAQAGPLPPEVLLNAGRLHSLADIAAALGTGYTLVDVETYVAEHVADGFPEPVARFFAGWFDAIRQGAFEETDGTLTRLLGHPPEALAAGLGRVFGL